MSAIAQKTVSMINMLPEKDQTLAYEIIKKLVLAWDPDFTKLTAEERKRFEAAKAEIENNDVVSHDEINWD